MPISCLPNAGLPEVVDGKMHYDLTPDQLAEHHTRFITELGVFRIQRKWGGTFTAIELAPGVTIEEIQAKTGAPVESAEVQAKAA